MHRNLPIINKELKEKNPSEIIRWALESSKNPILTTNFRPYEAAILHLCVKEKSNIKVLWCDSGYNTKATYLYAEKIISSLNLNIMLYKPIPKATYSRELFTGEAPQINDSRHEEFTEQVKLEPFKRAINEIKPDLWITNLRKGQTQFRDNIDIVSESNEGLLKVSPFYYWSDLELENYMNKNKLENEFDYFDPTKADEKRECGLHNRGSK